jgi:hypothetical protein
MSRYYGNEFKVGDKVITTTDKIKNVTEHKIYTVLGVRNELVKIKTDANELIYCNSVMFIDPGLYYETVMMIMVLRLLK